MSVSFVLAETRYITDLLPAASKEGQQFISVGVQWPPTGTRTKRRSIQ